MAITQDDVVRVAKLARLALVDDEKERFTAQLDNILSYVQKLDELDTSKISPTAHALTCQNVLREDIERPFESPEAIMENGPEIEDNAFVVPKIV